MMGHTPRSVNEFLQGASNPAAYAAGDAAATEGPRLTPVAAYDGMIAAANLLKGNHQKPTSLGVPRSCLLFLLWRRLG